MIMFVDNFEVVDSGDTAMPDFTNDAFGTGEEIPLNLSGEDALDHNAPFKMAEDDISFLEADTEENADDFLYPSDNSEFSEISRPASLGSALNDDNLSFMSRDTLPPMPIQMVTYRREKTI